MTGFAAADGAQNGQAWTWEIRGVNARGLDLRLRLPDRAQAIESEVRTRTASRVKRGAVNVSLKLKSDANGNGTAINSAALAAALAALEEARSALDAQGFAIGPTDPAALLGLPGVTGDGEIDALPSGFILADFDAAIAAFAKMRAQEGAALADVVGKQIDRVETLIANAQARLGDRSVNMLERYRAQVAELVAAAGQALDPDRLSHDLAALTVKGDVSEEIDRLTAHIAAARTLIAESGPIGRKLDFLMQEFNREANTLCAKSSDTELTRIGLDLKVVIDQMREQVQNLE